MLFPKWEQEWYRETHCSLPLILLLQICMSPFPEEAGHLYIYSWGFLRIVWNSASENLHLGIGGATEWLHQSIRAFCPLSWTWSQDPLQNIVSGNFSRVGVDTSLQSLSFTLGPQACSQSLPTWHGGSLTAGTPVTVTDFNHNADPNHHGFLPTLVFSSQVRVLLPTQAWSPPFYLSSSSLRTLHDFPANLPNFGQVAKIAK